MREGQILEVGGDQDAHNRGKLCIKGSYLLLISRLPGRLEHPLIRRNGELRRTSWDEAMGLVAERFTAVIASMGPYAVAFYGSGQLYNEESYTANKLFKAGVDTNNVDGNPRLCMASAAVGYVRNFGKDEPLQARTKTSMLLSCSSSLAPTRPSAICRCLSRCSRAVCVDLRVTMTAQRADLRLRPRPGSDLLPGWSMAQVICESGLADRRYIDAHVRLTDSADAEVDWNGLRAFLADCAPQRVTDRLGMAADEIRKLAHLFASSRATMSLWTMGSPRDHARQRDELRQLPRSDPPHPLGASPGAPAL